MDGCIETHLTADVAIEWIEGYAQFLAYCVETLHSQGDSHGAAELRIMILGLCQLLEETRNFVLPQ